LLEVEVVITGVDTNGGVPIELRLVL